MKTHYDIELLDILKTKIDSGIIVLHENCDNFINEINENYEWGFSKINWTDKNTVFFLDLSNHESSQRQKLVDDFLEKIILLDLELANEMVVIIGDALTNLGYEMKFRNFIEVNQVFSTIPQHTYIWFRESKKCINMTFEDELFFG